MKRLTSVDICRGIAVTCMVAADIPVITSVGFVRAFAGTLAAPFFIFIAGVSYELFVKAREEKHKNAAIINIETFWKAITLLAITQFIFLLGALLFPTKFPIGFNSSVFLVIAVGYLVSILIPGKWIYQLPLIILPFLILYFIDKSAIGGLSILLSSPFPIIPFISYFFAGRGIIGFFQSIADLKMKNWGILILSTILVAFAGLYSLFVIQNSWLPSRTTFLGFLLLTGIMILILSLFSIVKSRTERLDLILSPFERIGRIAFSTYYIFYALEIFLFPYLNRAFLTHYSPTIQIVIFYVSIIIVIIATASFEKAWSKFHYKPGMEWILRQGSAFMTNLTISTMKKVGICAKSISMIDMNDRFGCFSAPPPLDNSLQHSISVQ